MVRDPYEVLGVNPDADDDEIRRAHRRLVKQFHPDVDRGNSEAEFREVQDAYDTLINPEKRSFFDRSQARTRYRPDHWDTAWRGWSRSSPQGYHLDLRNLHAVPQTKPAIVYHRRGASRAAADDPFEVLRRSLGLFEQWLYDDWW